MTRRPLTSSSIGEIANRAREVFDAELEPDHSL
jgi:hypothetical protein